MDEKDKRIEELESELRNWKEKVVALLELTRTFMDDKIKELKE